MNGQENVDKGCALITVSNIYIYVHLKPLAIGNGFVKSVSMMMMMMMIGGDCTQRMA